MKTQFRQQRYTEKTVRTAGLGLALCLLFAACSNPAGTDGGTTAELGFTFDGPPENGLSGPEGGPFPTGTREYDLFNTGNHTLHFHSASEGNWMTFSPSSGVVDVGSSQRIVVSIDNDAASQLAVGTYRSRIRAASNPNAQGAVVRSFVLTVYEALPGSEMAVTPDDPWEFSGQVGVVMPATERTFTVTNAGEDDFSWSVAASQPWLAIVGSASGDLSPNDSADVTVALDSQTAQGFSAGDYDAVVSFVNTPSGLGNMEVPVQFTLTETNPGPDGRVTDGLTALYGFEEGSGNTVFDLSGVLPTMDLVVSNTNNVSWGPGALSIDSATSIVGQGPSTKLITASQLTNEVTIEAWVSPATTTQTGPARIVTMNDPDSPAPYEPDSTAFMLGQGRNDAVEVFTTRLTTTQHSGEPALTTPEGSVTGNLTHVVYTRDSSGASKTYVDGELSASMSMPGDFSNWGSNLTLCLANEVGGDRAWLGDLHLVALYDRALSASEVTQNHSAGTGDPQSGHLSVTPNSAFSAAAIEGESLSGQAKTYALTNTGTESIDWSVSASESWIVLADPHSGVLNPGQSHELLVRIQDSVATGFAPGQYSGTVSLTNQTNGFGNTSRDVILAIQPEGDPNPNGGGGGSDGDVEKPGPSNTGPSNPSILTSYSGPYEITQDGTVLENKLFTSTLRIKANNVTIRNFRITTGGSYGIQCSYGFQGTLIEDGEISGMQSAAVYGRNFTARRLNIHDSGGDGIKAAGGNAIIEYCWIHRLGTTPGAHADGDQTRWGSNFQFRFNNMDMPTNESGNGPGSPYNSNACFLFQTGNGPISDVTVEGNWLNGGNYTVYFIDTNVGYGPPQNVSLINNRFGRDYRHGPLSNHANLYSSGNVWDDTGEPMSINNN